MSHHRQSVVVGNVHNSLVQRIDGFVGLGKHNQSAVLDIRLITNNVSSSSIGCGWQCS
jgi:hypothetical protein